MAGLFSNQCDICGNQLRPVWRGWYRGHLRYGFETHHWELDGRKAILCGACDERMEEEMSRAAFDPSYEPNIPPLIPPTTIPTWISASIIIFLLAFFFGAPAYYLYQHQDDGVVDLTKHPPLAPHSEPIPALPPKPEAFTPGTPLPVSAAPQTLPKQVSLRVPIQIPVRLPSGAAGSVTVPAGTRVRLQSVNHGKAVIQYMDSLATIPVSATDLQ